MNALKSIKELAKAIKDKYENTNYSKPVNILEVSKDINLLQSKIEYLVNEITELRESNNNTEITIESMSTEEIDSAMEAAFS